MKILKCFVELARALIRGFLGLDPPFRSSGLLMRTNDTAINKTDTSFGPVCVIRLLLQLR